MKTLISQSEFAKLVNGNQGTISKYVKDGKLPAEGKKIIMPDAKEAYHMIQAGIVLAGAYDNKDHSQDFEEDEADNHLIVDNGKFAQYYFNDFKITCNNVFDNSNGMEISTSNFISQSYIYNGKEVAGVTFSKSDDYFSFEVVADEDYDTVLSRVQTIEGFGESVFLIKQSEIIELVKQKFGNDRYL